MPSSPDLIYRVDPADRICYANAQYDQFALANDGSTAHSTAVLHRLLWDFITEPTTQQLYRHALKRVRGGQTIRFVFRCDSPDCRRLMEMSVVSVGNQIVEFRTREVSRESRPPQSVLQRHVRRSNAFLRMCAWCNAVDVDGHWVEIEQATRQLGLLEQPHPPALTHGICDPCLAKMRETFSGPVSEA